MNIAQSFASALQHHKAGRLPEAEGIYRQILARQPEHPDCLHVLGLLCYRTDRPAEAIDLISRAIALNGQVPAYHLDLGNALKRAARFDDAIRAYRRAIDLDPQNPRAQVRLGDVLTASGRIDAAAAAFQRAIQLKPDYAAAYADLGNALLAMGKSDESLAACRRAVELDPQSAQAHNNLGNALREKRQFDEAILALRRATQLAPDIADIHSNLGVALSEDGQLEAAIESHRRAIALNPENPRALYNLGNALRDNWQLDDAIAAFRRAITLRPDYADACNNLANVLKDTAELDDALVAHRQAIALRPDEASIHSNLILSLHYHPACDAHAIARETRRWNTRHAEPLRQFVQPHANDRDPFRRLRIGYVSADFYDHASAFFLLPLFRCHDKQQYEIYCYSQRANSSNVTWEMKHQVQHWRTTFGLPDAKIAAQIRDDQIDILVDLKVHTAQNRLPVFAHKPAPVQVTWLGYPGSTGMDAVDYRLTDPYLDPPALFDALYSERSIRLPNTFWCYDPLATEPAVNQLPSLEKGTVTFGCLNNPCKINPFILELWAKVLAAVPKSQFLLLAPQGTTRERTLASFKSFGIEPARIQFTGRLDRPLYLQSFNRIDICLDTLPYNGHTTSLDSFWMGVPVVTLVGQTVVGRAGLSQLSNLGLSNLAALDPQQFVQIAASLANDLAALSDLRRTLRDRMMQSPLTDAASFARHVETVYRQIWRQWCER